MPEENVEVAWTAVLCAAPNAPVTEIGIVEPIGFLVFDYGDQEQNRIIFSQIGVEEASKKAFYFKTWQREEGKITLDAFNWGENPVKEEE